MKRLIARISGKVQKAGYRGKIVTIARAFGMRGYVQNLSDGHVKVVAEGDEIDLARFLNALKIRNSLIDVQNIETQYSAATGEYDGFEKMVAEGETDQRLDKAADLLKGLIVVNKEVVKELKATHEDLGDEIRATREDLRAEIKATREDLKDEMKASREEAKATGEMLAEKIDNTKDEVVGEIRELRCEMRDDLKERLVRMEADVSQIKARIGL